VATRGEVGGCVCSPAVRDTAARARGHRALRARRHGTGVRVRRTQRRVPVLRVRVASALAVGSVEEDRRRCVKLLGRAPIGNELVVCFGNAASFALVCARGGLCFPAVTFPDVV
jgi:hypothetical protein